MPHGGFLAALADNAMGLSLGVNLAAAGQSAAGLITVSLTLDYLGSAKLGPMARIRHRLHQAGPLDLLRLRRRVRADGVPVARARATFEAARRPSRRL
ncbi:PaaI family thioesterase [Caulobacter segnis]